MTIWIVFKNADFTEGRRPMLYESCHTSLESAKKHINTFKVGIFGAKPPQGMTLADWCMTTRTDKRSDGTTYEVRADSGWGGFEIRKETLKD